MSYEEHKDQIEVHWQHPRHELENPVLLVWPNQLRDEWAAEVRAEGVAGVVCHMQLYETDDDEIKKLAKSVGPDEHIPEYVAKALLDYDGKYGPIDEVVNPYDGGDEFEPDTFERAEKRLTEL